MSSRTYEVDHETKLRDLLSRAGLECLRPSPPSTVTSESEEVVETEEMIEVHEEGIEKEESLEKSVETIEETPEVEAEIFPTPSLRRLIPDQQRRIEEMNRIQVLPQKFIINFASESIPVIVQTPPIEIIDILGNMTGCRNYKTNLAEYWFLDTLANLLRRAQRDQMDKGLKLERYDALGLIDSQAILMAWFCVWMKEMQHFDAADRQRMIKKFQDNVTAAAKFIALHHRLPTPEEVGIIYEASDTQGKNASTKAKEDNVKNTDSVSKISKGIQGKNSHEQGKKGGRIQGTQDKKQVKKDDKNKGMKSDKGPSKNTIDKSKKDVKSPDRKSDKNPVKTTDINRNDIGSSGSPSRKGAEDNRSEKVTKSKGIRDENETPEKENFECALVDLTHIAHYIYDLFSTDYQYHLVRSVFTFSPEYIQMDAPYQMRVPKKLLGPQLLHKQKLVLDKDNTKASLLSKKERLKKRDDYVKLLELQEREERSLAEQEFKDRADWLRWSHILPLFAARNDSTHRLRSSAQSDSSDRRDRH